MAWFEEAGTLVAALGLGSVIGQYVATSGQRRATRGEVLNALGAAETARWAGSPGNDDFARLIRELETKALIARLPRLVIAQYRWMAFAAYWASAQASELSPGDEYAGGIDPQLAKAVSTSAEILTSIAWSRWRVVLLPFQVSQLRRNVQTIAGKSARMAIERSSQRYGV